MFDDDQIKSTGGVPNNLPIGEPDDMFAGVYDTPVNSPAIDSVPTDMNIPQTSPASALGAGVLRPKVEEQVQNNFSNPVPVVAPQMQVDNVARNDFSSPLENNNQIKQPNNNLASVPVPMSVHPQEIYQIKEPAIGKGIVRLVVVGVVVVILGGGSWWIYNSFIKDNSNSDAFDVPVDFVDATIPTDFTDENLVDETPIEDVVVVDETLDNNVVDDLSGTVVDDQVLFGEPIDKDVDGLDDDIEINIGTDPNNWDSDFDELSDGDEVSVWKTNPLNPDTDGDTYLDGAEIKNGYSPTGPGKLFEPPVETPIQ